jgi:PAS domain S-box-containing protein
MLAAPPIPDNEEARLAALEDYQLLDTASEDIFDAFARAAAQVCGVPIGLISLVDRDRQYFKANVGLGDLIETPRNVSFCAYAILQDGIMEVPDAKDDERFRSNPLVTADPRIRFYAGVPLVVAGGEALGTLCVLDRTPHELSLEQRTALRAIADAVLEAVESRRAMLRLFDSSQSEIYHLDVKERRLIFASEAARTNLGYSLGELRGITIADLLPEMAIGDRYEAFLVRMGAGLNRGMTFRSQARRKDGSTYPVEVRAELMQTRKRELALLFFTDLTERIEANRRIELLSAAVETAQDAILITSPPPDAHTPSTIVYANEAYLRQKQVTLDEVIGKPSNEFHGPKTDRAALVAFREQLLAGKSAHVEYITYRKDGSEYYIDVSARPMVDADGRVSHFVIVVRDVTDAVMRGMTLELQNERLTALTSIARDLFSALDPRVLAQSLLVGVRELTGGEGRLLALRSDGALVDTDDLSAPPEAADAGDTFLRTALTAPISVLDDDNRRLAIGILGAGRRTAFMLDVRAGEAAFVAADVFAFGLLAQYFAVAARNVELYRELAARRSSVVELNQVKNDLIAMLAHDFKGPLTTIVGFADVLAEDERFDDESRQFLAMISSSALRLASLATDTLALSRLEQNDFSLHVEPVDLNELVRDVARIFSVTRTIDIRAGEGPHLVTGDRGRLRQVFENIVGNAIKYSPGGETVEIRVRRQNDGVEVSVRDRGIGIPDADRGKLFGRFARASNARELGIGGTGFGLYLAKRIVEMHGGTIGVASRVGAGSTFKIALPTSPKPQQSVNRRVLLLDSEGDARSYIAHTLREDGMAITVVGTEDDVVTTLDADAFDAAVIDVDLIGRDEAAFIARVARRTALVRLGTAGIPAESGWDAALGKPFLIKDLREAVDRAIGRHAASLK